MKKFPIYPMILAIACLVLANSARAQTADEIVAKNIAAHGGEKFTALRSMRVTGPLQLAPGVSATLIQDSQRPNLMRMDMILGAMTSKRAYDGKNGWALMPQEGDAAPRAMRPAELKDALEESDFGGPLLDYKQKGHQIEYQGKEAVDGRDCHKLKVILKSGEVRTIYIDAETFLESRISGTSKGAQDVETSFVQTLSDYRPVDGVMIAFSSMVEVVQGNEQPQKFTYKIEKAEVNPKFEEGHFTMPEKAPATQEQK